MAMKGTSYRTLMLLTTLFAVVVIFQATVRSPQPAACSVPVRAYPDAPDTATNQDPNEPQGKAATHPPAMITVMAETPALWLDDEPEDPNEPQEAPPAEPE
ncbi:MAG: hypothetical protein FJ280_04140 [Planctomycetes bacterium]|nr:hypothetical protein [Planctomycetota bacterium]